jgi:hypothetical protein
MAKKGGGDDFSKLYRINFYFFGLTSTNFCIRRREGEQKIAPFPSRATFKHTGRDL